MRKIKRKVLPDREESDGVPAKRQPYTLPNVAAVVSWMEWRVMFNVMEHRPVIVGEDVGESAEDQITAMHLIEDNLTRVGVVCGQRLGGTLAAIGRRDRFHPMQDWMESIAWDGVDRIALLTATVPTSDELWPLYLRRWLVQVAEAACGWYTKDERSLPHCLVFAGMQGAGKTQWFRNLAKGFVRTEAELHLNKSDSKDHKLDVLRFPIVELSEIDATFGQSHISSLKTFLSSGRDVIRPPFGARAEERVRSSVFGGTVNEPGFLVDLTGSRRFWPVLVIGDINWKHAIDMQQLWAQVLVLWEEGESMYLTAEEYALSAADAVRFEDVSPASEAVEGFWADNHHDYGNYAALNVSQICGLTGTSTHPAAVKAVRSWLTKNLGKGRTIDSKQRAWAFPVGDKESITGYHIKSRLPEVAARKMANWKG